MPNHKKWKSPQTGKITPLNAGNHLKIFLISKISLIKIKYFSTKLLKTTQHKYLFEK